MTTINASNNPRLTTNGQLIIGSTGAFPVAATITAGTNITVTNGAGSITIAASGGTTPPSVLGPPFPFATICTLPGMFGSTVSDNITQSINYNQALFLMPFFLNTALTTSNIGTLVKVVLAASTATLGIYASNASMQPNGAALGAVSVDTSSLSNTQSALAVSLSANTLYWAALQLSSNATLAVATPILNVFPGAPGGSFGLTSYNPANYSYAHTYAAGSLPSITPGSLTAGGVLYGPLIYVN